MIRNPQSNVSSAPRLRRRYASLVLSIVFLLGSGEAQQMVQVPFGTTYLGVPASTWNGTDGQPCTSTTPGYLDFEGDGCPANQAILNYPLGVAIDSNNSFYVAEYGNKLIRVVYNGGAALAAALVAANPLYTFTPVLGNVYPIGGLTATLTSRGGVYYCNNTSGATALDKYGNGCPAQQSYDQSRAVAVDRDGNIFLAGIYPTNGVRIVYVGGAAGAKLISTYNPGITSPQVGYIYPLSASGDFSSIRDIYVDDNENIYASDTGTQAAATGLQATTTGNQIKRFSGTGWTTFLLGSTSASATGVNGDGGPVASAIANNILAVYVDHSGNIYFAEGSGRIRVVYNGGSTPPLYVQGANVVVVTNPVAGNVYSVAGGGTLRTSGSLASALNVSVAGASLSSFALDNAGNFLFTDSQGSTSTVVYGYTWRIDARTGIATIIGGSGANPAAASAAAVPAAGVPCNGATGGPVMTDAFDDGCPATEILPYTPRSRMVFDTAGNYYQIETRIASQNDGILRKYTFTNQLGSVAVGSTASAPLAFTPVTSAPLTPSSNFVITGNSTAEWMDAGKDLCSVSGTSSPTQTCVYNVTFKPALAGPRLGALNLSAGVVNLISVPIGGTGIAPQLTLDPAAQTNIGAGLKPTGTGVDQGGNIYIADANSGALYKSVAGGAPTQVATGLKNPAQVAVDNAGNVFVADAGNNRVAVAVNLALPSAELNALNALKLSNPNGVAADLAGNIYIADTGNNRVLMVSQLGGVYVKAFSGLSSPHGLAVDAAGNIFVADYGNSRVVELPAAIGNSQSPQIVVAVSPALVSPVAVAVDPSGTLYVADAGNQNVVVIPTASGIATPLLGNTASLAGLAADATGNVFIASSSLTWLVALNRTNIAYAFPDTNLGQTSSRTLSLSNTGNSPLVLGSPIASSSDSVDFSVSNASTSSCSAGQSLSAGRGCAVLATFMPASKGPLKSTISFSSNAADSASALLTGIGVQKVSTTMTLTYTDATGGQPIAGQPFTVTATITPSTNAGDVTGSVLFSVDGGAPSSSTVTNGSASTVSTVAAGNHNITASYSGDAVYVAAAAALNVVAVSPAATTTSLAVTSAGTPGNGAPFTVTATIASAASQGPITGTVVFTLTGITPAQTQTVTVANGAASASFTLPTGNYSVSATYSGNPYYLTSTGTLPVKVIPAGTSSVKLTLTSPTGSIVFGQTVAVAASITTGNSTATPTGTVSVGVDGGAPQSFAYAPSVAASFALLSGGSHTITATYSGDNSYAPSSGSLSITIVRATPGATLSVTPNISSTGNSFVITTTLASSVATPTGTVTLTVGGAAYGPTTLVNGAATFLTKTNQLSGYAFSATYSGDANFQPLTFTSNPAPDFVAAVQSASVTTPQYGVALDYVTLNSFYGYTGTVQISCSGLPANTVCRPSPISNSVSADGLTTVQLQIFTDVDPRVASAALGSAPFVGHVQSIAAAVCVSILFVLPFARARRRIRAAVDGITLSLFLLLASSTLSGCGSDTSGPNNFITPTGTYPITITTTDGHATHTTVLTLTVLAGSPGRP